MYIGRFFIDNCVCCCSSGLDIFSLFKYGVNDSAWCHLDFRINIVVTYP